MAIALTCVCGARLEVDETFAGRSINCPDCKQPLKVPGTAQAARPTNVLALTSTVLALVGAFTIVGSLAAAVCGGMALLQINRRRDQSAGLGFAVFGLTAGLLLTGVTLVLFRYPDSLPVGRYFRSSQWSDQVDMSGQLDIDFSEKHGFKISRPKDWGVVKEGFKHRLIDSLRTPGSQLLLMQPSRFAFIDVSSHIGDPRTMVEDFKQDNLKEDLHPPGANPNGETRNNAVVIDGVKIIKADDQLQNDNGVRYKDFVVELMCGGQPWTMIVRRCYGNAGGRFYVLRAFAPRRAFAGAEKDMREALDSLKLP
jgi:hypothetical protein